jgi:hypothetical protein
MKYYDIKEIKENIDNAVDIKAAVLGIKEDWAWTSEVIYEKGKYLIDLVDELTIAGIPGSSWGTPTLEIIYKNDTMEMIEVSTGENCKTPPTVFLGCLSKPIQDEVNKIELKNKR